MSGRIAFALPDLNSGGAGRAALNLAAALPGTRGLVVAEWRRGDLLDDPLAADVVFLSEAAQRRSRIPRILALVRWLRAERPAVLVSMLSPVVTTIAGRLAGVPVVHWLQAPLLRTTGGDEPGLRGWARRRVLRTVGQASLLTLGVTPGIVEECRRIGVSEDRLGVLPNGLVLPDAAELDARAPWSGDRVVCVGRLERPKRQDLLIEALADERLADVTVTLVGSGADEAQLRALADARGVSKRVRFTGFVASPHGALAQADVFVLPTEYEGFGNVIVEAMAHGMPVVVSDVPHGPRYVLEDGAHGTLVAPGSGAALAAALAEVLAAGPLPQDRRAAAVARAREFSLARVADRFGTELEGALRAPGSAGSTTRGSRD